MDPGRTRVDIEPHLLTTRQLLRSGMSQRSVTAAVRAERLHRLRPGWYAPASFWAGAKDEELQLAALSAFDRSRRAPAVLSHVSAATLLRFPVWSAWLRDGHGPLDPRVVHATVPPSSRGNSPPSVRRHRCALDAVDTMRSAGILCTTPDRTLFDLARSEPFPAALACADAVLRRSVRFGAEVDVDAWRRWREGLLGRAAALPHGRGVRAVRALAHLAHPLSDSPLESMSRLRLLQLGIDVEPQHPVPAESGGTLRLDFLFTGLGIFGECDGKAKYFDPGLLGGRTAEDVVYDEKLRYDWICGVTGMRGVRWGASHAARADRLAGRLRSFDVPVPGYPTRSYGPEIAAFLDRLPR
ncbi:type IV toxin-antitoxin system AbiEi family antitoxin domain-containing protein [Leucobacter sp. CSA1]|uniref:Type IV toxin-antitoxin system AbiEi family antitoxin domain-containing protein n=1 Tax=Leucobacter chromiisoli TaxID=2796471 RepID=A0A934Q6L2_9MICO|nr:type IV toxin-antitoxin system AbiEi family antitoxin domain-containing protein [Leucobacter chromiisoli]MBK0418330.1 type IV toxin-antitoxin system AbiEi family antitoxin domain-containing protein [Leucobacter chromiisoli]